MDAVAYRSEWRGGQCGAVSNTAWCREVKAGVATAGMPMLGGRVQGRCRAGAEVRADSRRAGGTGARQQVDREKWAGGEMQGRRGRE